MKPIIIDMKDMSDSTEVYDSKPNRFMVYTIYVVLLLFIVALIWMCFFKVDIVVKSNGIFKGSNALYEVSNLTTGRVKENLVLNGQYVNKGDVLYLLDIDDLSDAILRYQDELKTLNDRLEILSAYEKSLEGDVKELEACSNNQYYHEFVNRRDLLYANMNMNINETNEQIAVYQGSIDSISETIAKYNEKVKKLTIVKQCVSSQENTFDSTDSYYYSMVNSYLASYSYTLMQYDNQINECQRQIDSYGEQIKKFEEQDANNESVEMESLRKQRGILIESMESIKKEKTQALLNLELQQISAIEQQISSYNDTIISLESNLVSAKLQMELLNDKDGKTKEAIVILTEKGNIAAEILNCKERAEECETYLRSYEVQKEKSTIRANATGYYYAAQHIKPGTYIQEGTTLGTIYPEQESRYYAEIYVENSNIGKVKEGQRVKFEISAYPSSEYGYFTGVVENISKDISIDSQNGYAYYLVQVSCDNMIVKNADGDEASLVNGMACEAKIIIDEKNVLTYLLEKIDLLD